MGPAYGHLLSPSPVPPPSPPLSLLITAEAEDQDCRLLSSYSRHHTPEAIIWRHLSARHSTLFKWPLHTPHTRHTIAWKMKMLLMLHAEIPSCSGLLAHTGCRSAASASCLHTQPPSIRRTQTHTCQPQLGVSSYSELASFSGF